MVAYTLVFCSIDYGRCSHSGALPVENLFNSFFYDLPAQINRESVSLVQYFQRSRVDLPIAQAYE
jgi:hypothetical protein